MRLYLSAPMRGVPRYNAPWFALTAASLRAMGHDVISPWEHDLAVDPGLVGRPEFLTGEPMRDPGIYHDLLGWDLAQIARPGNIDGIALGPGWENSVGCKHERYVAEATGKRIFYVVEVSDAEARAQGRKDGGLYLIEDEPATIIGLMGYAQVGKDTTAQILVEEHGYERIAFADALRDVLYALNPVIVWGNGMKWIPLRNAVDEVGWDRVKVDHPMVREMLQRCGTEAGRNIIGENVWVDAAMRKVKPGGKYVFSDVRFPNEVAAIRNAGGQLWRITRPGYGPVNDHPSETAVDDVDEDVLVPNVGLVSDLAQAVKRVLA